MLGIVVLEAVPILEGSVLNRERNCTDTDTKEPKLILCQQKTFKVNQHWENCTYTQANCVSTKKY